jgi:hypothetical protein
MQRNSGQGAAGVGQAGSRAQGTNPDRGQSSQGSLKGGSAQAEQPQNRTQGMQGNGTRRSDDPSGVHKT